MEKVKIKLSSKCNGRDYSQIVSTEKDELLSVRKLADTLIEDAMVMMKVVNLLSMKGDKSAFEIHGDKDDIIVKASPELIVMLKKLGLTTL